MSGPNHPARIAYAHAGEEQGCTVDLVGIDSLLEYEMDDGEDLAGIAEGEVLRSVQLTYMRSPGPDLFPLEGAAYAVPAARVVESTWVTAGRKRVRLEQLPS